MWRLPTRLHTSKLVIPPAVASCSRQNRRHGGLNKTKTTTTTKKNAKPKESVYIHQLLRRSQSVQNRWVNLSCVHLYFFSLFSRGGGGGGGSGGGGKGGGACLPLVEWNPRIVRDHTGSLKGGRGQSPQRWLTIHTVHLLRGSARALKAWGFKRNLASVKNQIELPPASENVQITHI